jgi:hypothetical protein
MPWLRRRGGVGGRNLRRAGRRAARLRQQHLRAEIHQVQRTDDADGRDRAVEFRQHRGQAEGHRAETDDVPEHDAGRAGHRAAHAVARGLRHHEHHGGAGRQRHQRPGGEIQQEGLECHGDTLLERGTRVPVQSRRRSPRLYRAAIRP